MQKNEKYLLAMINRLNVRLSEEIETSLDYESQLEIATDSINALTNKIGALEAKPKADFARVEAVQKKSKATFEKILHELRDEMATMKEQHAHEVDHLNAIITDESQDVICYADLQREVETLRVEKENLQDALMDLTKEHMELKSTTGG